VITLPQARRPARRLVFSSAFATAPPVWTKRGVLCVSIITSWMEVRDNQASQTTVVTNRMLGGRGVVLEKRRMETGMELKFSFLYFIRSFAKSTFDFIFIYLCPFKKSLPKLKYFEQKYENENFRSNTWWEPGSKSQPSELHYCNSTSVFFISCLGYISLLIDITQGTSELSSDLSL
jgi:hypothetical protein